MVDHLHLPAQPLSRHPVIPYLVNADPQDAYDGQGFASFPQRRGFDKARLLDGDFQGRSSAELNEFFQSWLFFGILHEVLTTAGEQVNLADFVQTTSKGQRCITTLPLRKHLRRWRQREINSGRGLISTLFSLFGPPWYARLRVIDDCLLEAVTVTRKLLTSASPWSLPRAQQPTVLPEICLSIIVLGSTLNTAKSSVIPQYVADTLLGHFGSDESLGESIISGQIPYMPRDVPSWGPADYTVSKLEESGWCPMEIERLKELSDSAMYFTSQVQRLRLNTARGHDGCTREKCRAYQIDNNLYRPQHRPDCGGCGEVQFLTADVATLVGLGQIPLVRVEKKGNLIQPSLVPDNGSDYIAISHIWAQGLGNRTSNALTRCQFTNIWHLVAEIYGTDDTEVVLFWIDTLCVPLAPRDVKKHAIARMKDVYRNAYSVLVLDEELQRIPCPFPIANAGHAGDAGSNDNPSFETINSRLRELYIRLFVSPWFQRLWTLQEGALAKNLLLRFADGSFSMRNLVQSAYNSELFGNPYQAADELPMHLCDVVLDLKDAGHSIRLGRVSPLLCYRDTSELSDEALCIGGILDLNTTDIIFAGETPQQKMLNLYQQLSHVPVGLLFLDGRRLEDDGFRWAPSSLLGMRQTLTQSLELTTTGRLLGSNGGLLVRNWGFLLKRPNGPVPPVFYVKDSWLMYVQPGEENNQAHIAETKKTLEGLLSDLSPFGNYDSSDFSFTFRVSYHGTIPWEFQPGRNADFGILMEQSLVHRDGSGVFKKAVLLNKVVRQSAQDASSSIRELVSQEDTDVEMTSTGCFVARMQLEAVSLEEWKEIQDTSLTENTAILVPEVGGVVSNWIVR